MKCLFHRDNCEHFLLDHGVTTLNISEAACCECYKVDVLEQMGSHSVLAGVGLYFDWLTYIIVLQDWGWKYMLASAIKGPQQLLNYLPGELYIGLVEIMEEFAYVT